MIDDIEAGKLINTASLDPSSGSLPYGVVSNHDDAVTGFHTGAQGQVVFDLLNPCADGSRRLHLSWAQIRDTFYDWEYVRV